MKNIEKLREIRSEISEQIKLNAQHIEIMNILDAGMEILFPLMAISNHLEKLLERVEKIIREAP